MRRYKYLILLVLVALVITGCSVGYDPIPSVGSLAGRILYDDGNMEPVVGAYVKVISGYTTRPGRTNYDGYFEINNIRAGTATVIIEHLGIRGGEYRDSVTIPSGYTNTKDLWVPRATAINIGDVRGYVYVPATYESSSLGEELDPLISDLMTAPAGYVPLRGATIRVGSQPPVTTGTYGEFHVPNVLPGQYNLTATHASLRKTITRTVEVFRGQTTWLGGDYGTPLIGGAGYYIVIGIGDYPGEPTIPGSVANAQKVYQSLYGVNDLAAGRAELLINANATKSRIQAAIDRANSKAQSLDDYLIIYFSGISGKDFISPSDDLGNDWRRSITDGELEQWVRNFSGSVTLIIDGSESSSMADGTVFQPQAFRKPEYTVISAAGPKENVFYDANLGSSVFTHFLVKGISGWNPPADADRNRDITAYELYQYIYTEMDYYLYRDPDRHLPVFWGSDYRNAVIFRY